MINGGNMSSIGDYYNGPDELPTIYADKKDYLNDHQAYNYLFENGKWYYSPGSEPFSDKNFHSVEDVLDVDF